MHQDDQSQLLDYVNDIIAIVTSMIDLKSKQEACVRSLAQSQEDRYSEEVEYKHECAKDHLKGLESAIEELCNACEDMIRIVQHNSSDRPEDHAALKGFPIIYH